MLIEVKVKVARVIDNKTRKRTETFIIDKEFFSEAEYVVTQELSEEQNSHLVENFEVLSLKVSPIKEVCTQFEGENSYTATLVDMFLEDDGTEKPIKYKVLLWANSLTEANTNVQTLAKEGYNMLVEGIKQTEVTYLTEE